MQNLNKENYFNQLKEKYPKAMELFCQWIDKYKQTADWNELFNSSSEWQSADGKNAPAPKFHDLPYELQYGLLLRFFAEHGRIVFLSPPEAGAWFETIFASIEQGTMGLLSNETTSPGSNAIFMERMKQIEIDGNNVDKDKANENGELSDVAVVLLTGDTSLYPSWWSKSWLEKAMAKPEKIRKIWAGALIAADLDRIIEDEKLSNATGGNN